MSTPAIDFSKYEQQVPAQIDFSKYESAAVPPLGTVQLSNPSTVPNARMRNLPNPAAGETSALGALYHGAKTGAMLATPLTLPEAGAGLIPRVAGALAGGTVGGTAGKEIAKEAGAGELGQEVSGDVGGVAGAAGASAAADWTATKLRSFYDLLPPKAQDALLEMLPRRAASIVKGDVLGTISPAAKHAGEFVNALREAKTAEAAPGAAGNIAESVAAPQPAPAAKVSPKTVEQQLETALGGQKLVPGVPLRSQPAAQAAAAGKLPEGFTPVESSALKGYKYNPDTREFESITTGGQHYIHGDVGPDEARYFADAESKGKAWQQIRSQNPLVAKVVNGQRVAVKPVQIAEEAPAAGPAVPTPKPKTLKDLSGEGDLTAQLNASLNKANVQKGTDIPKFVYRARDVGEEGVPLKNEHAQATSDYQQAQTYAEPGQRNNNPGEVVRIDLSKLKPSDYVVKNHPSGMKWVKFTRPLTEDEVKLMSPAKSSSAQ